MYKIEYIIPIDRSDITNQIRLVPPRNKSYPHN